ncbi:MAG: hypothetical protein ACOC3D_00945 [Pseudomonadota bacterium]
MSDASSDPFAPWLRSLGPVPWSRATSTSAFQGVAALGAIQRNALLDTIFYDVNNLTDEEVASLRPWLAKEGAILVVPPSGGSSLEVYASLADFESVGTRRRLGALAVAGVGSSALGAAAFARNVADAYGGPVAAVVSGYGLADLLTEALGGFFWFGQLNGLRHLFELVEDPLAFLEPYNQSRGTLASPLLHLSRDTRTVYRLLMAPGANFDLVVGHSKGNLVLSEALYGLARLHPERAADLARAMTIVTVSAVIAMPSLFPRIIDVIGELDDFGRFNSRRDIDPDVVVPEAWHHTNTALPGALAVTPVLEKVLASRAAAPPALVKVA